MEVIHSLRMQLIIYSVLISFSVLAIGGYFSYIYILDMLKKNNENYLLQEFRQAEYNIQNVFNNVDKLIGLFILNDSVQDFLDKEDEEYDFDFYVMQTSLFKTISQIKQNYDYINSIYIFNKYLVGMGGSINNSKTFLGKNSNSRIVSEKTYLQVVKPFPEKIFLGGVKEELTSQKLTKI